MIDKNTEWPISNGMSIRLKTKEDIETLREGGRRHAAILAQLADLVAPGVSTLTIEEEAQRLVRGWGGKPALLGYRPRGAKRDFPACLCISINDEVVHGIPNENIRVLKEGDLVSIDMGFSYKGMITDSAITVGVGHIDDEGIRLMETSKRALQRGIEACRPGNTTGDIGFAIESEVERAGFSTPDGLAGHGVGFSVHEDPFVPNFGRPGQGEKLVPGMVIAIEPMVNAGGSQIKVLKDDYTIVTKDGKRSVHFEHTVAITEKGHLILTK